MASIYSSPRQPPPFDEAAYRKHIHRRYRYLQLEALTGNPVLLQHNNIDLQQVFVPQGARECLPDTLDVPARCVLGLLDDPAIPHRVVLGAAGSGKSLLIRLRLLAWAESPADRSRPIIVNLRHFQQSQSEDLLEYLTSDADLPFRFSHQELHAWLEAGIAELLFDGLDEIFSPAARERITWRIARYGQAFPSARILVTSRLIDYRDLGILRDRGFGHWLLEQFDEPRINAFIEQWIKHAVSERYRLIVRQRIRDALGSPVVQEFAGNPLLLTLMAVRAIDSDLPRDLGHFYKHAADLLLQNWDAWRHLLTPSDYRYKHKLLCDLAWKMLTSPQRGVGGNLISENEVKHTMNADLKHCIPDDGLRRKTIEELLFQLIERNQFLGYVTGHGDAQLAFINRGFLKFFASEYLANQLIAPDTSLEALRRLGEANPQFAPDLAALLLANPDPTVRRRAAYVLRSMDISAAEYSPKK